MEVFKTINNLIYALAVSNPRFDRSEYMISIGEEVYKALLEELRGLEHLYSLENVRDLKTFAGVEMVINYEKEHMHEIRIFKEVTATRTDVDV